MSNTYMDNILLSLVIPCLTKLIENLHPTNVEKLENVF